MMKFPHEEGKSGMSLKKYEAFVRTVELGSLTKAAEAMGSTQSRISHVLSALEEEYGFVLLRRNRYLRDRPRRRMKDILVIRTNMVLKFTIRNQIQEQLRLKILKIQNKNEELRRIM